MSELDGMEIRIVDGREHLLMLTVDLAGQVQIHSQLDPPATAELLRDVAAGHERHAPPGGN